VQAYDVATGNVQTEQVQHVFVNNDSKLSDVTLVTLVKSKQLETQGPKNEQWHIQTALQDPGSTNETIHTTTEHLFLTKEKGWVNAQDLEAGMHVLRTDGFLGMVTATTNVSGSAVRYNLTVAEKHTFLVGINRWVVHNCGTNGLPKSYVVIQ